MKDYTTGGTRDRLIHDAVATLIKDSLGDLGWDALGSKWAPLNWADEPITDETKEVPLNTIALSSDSTPAKTEGELGSTYGEQRYPFYVDFYAENEDLGKDLIGDVRDILRGEFPAIGRVAPVVWVYDTTQDPVPDTPAFGVEVDQVETDRATRATPKPYEQFWFVCRFELVDDR